MPSETIEQNNPNPDFHYQELFDSLENDLSGLPIASSSSATITPTETIADEDERREYYQTQTLHPVENMAAYESICTDFKKFITDEFANNQQLYSDHPIVTIGSRKKSPHLSYTGFSVGADKGIYFYSVYLPQNLTKKCFTSFNEPIVAAVAHDFIVKAFDKAWRLNFSAELYTQEKIQACKNILMPIIRKHEALNELEILNETKEKTIPPLSYQELRRIKTAFLRFLNAFKEKNDFHFIMEELYDPHFGTKTYSGVYHADKHLKVFIYIGKKKINCGTFKDKIIAALAYDFIAKILKLDTTPNLSVLYTEEEVRSCEKIILPLLKDKINRHSKDEKQTEEETGASAAAVPKNATDQPLYNHPPNDYLESTSRRQNKPLTYVYPEHSARAGSIHKDNETSDYEQIDRANKKARIGE